MSRFRECVRKSIPDWQGKPFGEPKFHRFGNFGLTCPALKRWANLTKNVGAGETCPKILRANFIRPYGFLKATNNPLSEEQSGKAEQVSVVPCGRRLSIVVDKPDATS